MPSKAGKPIAEQVAGNVGLSPQTNSNPLNPGEEVLFVLDNDMSGFLVELLRGDVRDEDIKIEISTTTGGWTGTMDEIPGVVKAVAQTVLERLHRQ